MSAALSAFIVGLVSVASGYLVPKSMATGQGFLAWVAQNEGLWWQNMIPSMGAAALVGGYFGALAGVIAGLLVWALIAYFTKPVAVVTK